MRIGYLPDPLVDYLQHETNLGYTATHTEVGCRVMDASSMTIPKFPERDIGARIGALSQRRMETGAATC